MGTGELLRLKIKKISPSIDGLIFYSIKYILHTT